MYSSGMKTHFPKCAVLSIGLLLVASCSNEGSEQATDGAEALLSPYQSCVEQAAAMNLEAKTAYQTELRDLVVANRSDFAPLADVNLEFQLSLSQLRAARIGYLLRTDDARLITDQGASAFTNFDWSIKDEAGFVAADPEHADLIAKAAQWREMNDGHKVWPAFRSWFGETLASSDELDAITGRLVAARDQLEAHLVTCQ